MPKKFFTERDIEDLFSRGVSTLEIDDNTVLTELAYERAGRLGLHLVQAHENPPSAPVRPYIAQTPVATPAPAPSTPAQAAAKDEGDLRKRVREAAVARLGGQVDPALLDSIITRVLNSVGIK